MILAGGAHHTVYSFAVSTEQMLDFAEMTGIECVIIDKNTNLVQFRNELRRSHTAWK